MKIIKDGGTGINYIKMGTINKKDICPVTKKKHVVREGRTLTIDYLVHSDFLGQDGGFLLSQAGGRDTRGRTMTRITRLPLVPCWKCKNCGKSWTK